MFFVWKGYGAGVLLICMIAAACLLPFEAQFNGFGVNGVWIEWACICAATASGTLVLATWLEKRDRKADKELDAKAAQARHTLYWIPLMSWGYIAAVAASALFITGCVSGAKI